MASEREMLDASVARLSGLISAGCHQACNGRRDSLLLLVFSVGFAVASRVPTRAGPCALSVVYADEPRVSFDL